MVTAHKSHDVDACPESLRLNYCRAFLICAFLIQLNHGDTARRLAHNSALCKPELSVDVSMSMEIGVGARV